MHRMTRFLLAAVCLVALAATGAARAEEFESMPKAELVKKLRPAYDALNRDPVFTQLE